MKLETNGIHSSLGTDHAWLDAILPAPPARILDAGCGPGDLARRLLDRGYDVTAIDIDPAEVATARAAGVPAEVANLVDYKDAPFDVVTLTLSLHHMHPMRAAVERAGSLLSRDGLLILEEFAWDRADHGAVSWFYDTTDLLASAGLVEPGDQPNGADPMTRWRARHADHTGGDEMVDAVSERFAITHLRRTPYLARFVGGLVEDTARGRRVGAELARIERDRIGRGDLPEVGFHLVSRHQEVN